MRESRCPGGGDSVLLVVTLSAVRTDGGISTASRHKSTIVGGFFCGHKQHKRPGRRRSLVVLPNHLSRAFISPLLEAFKGLRVLSLGMDHNRFR
jgi:hypothetical protein